MSVQRSLSLHVLGCGVSIHCDHSDAMALLRANFWAMIARTLDADLRYRVVAQGHTFVVWRNDDVLVGNARDLGALVYILDSDIIVQLQLIRKELLFIHGAVVTDATGAHILTGHSGAGKSTTCWGLLQRGFGYLSDELAPIHLVHTTVHPFPRALCLKNSPPKGFELPPETCGTPRGFHIPVSSLPSCETAVPLPVRTLLFVEYAADREKPAVCPIGPAEAAARLYPNVLNALAHHDAAMNGVTRVASSARAFLVQAAELRATCDGIQTALRHDHHDAPSCTSGSTREVR